MMVNAPFTTRASVEKADLRHPRRACARRSAL